MEAGLGYPVRSSATRIPTPLFHADNGSQVCETGIRLSRINPNPTTSSAGLYAFLYDFYQDGRIEIWALDSDGVSLDWDEHGSLVRTPGLPFLKTTFAHTSSNRSELQDRFTIGSMEMKYSYYNAAPEVVMPYSSTTTGWAALARGVSPAFGTSSSSPCLP